MARYKNIATGLLVVIAILAILLLALYTLTLRTQQTLYIGFILRRYLYTKHERTSLCGRSLTDKNVSSAGHEQHDGLVGGKKQVPAKKRPLDSAIGPNNNALSFKIPFIPRLAQNRCGVSAYCVHIL